MPDAATWEQCLADFLTDLENRSGSKAARSHYAPYIRKVFKDFSRDPATYSRAEVIAFINAPSFGSVHHGLPAAPATKRHRQAAIASFLRYASSYSIPSEAGPVPLLSVMPVTAGMRYPRATVAPRGMSDDELRRLFAAIPKTGVKSLRDRATLLVFFWSARRRSEVALLRRGDFSETTFTNPDGSERHAWVYRWRGKGRKQEDDRAEMPAPAMRAIFAYLEADGRAWETMRGDEPIFKAVHPPQGGGFAPEKEIAFSGRAMNRMLHVYCAKAGLSPEISLHSLRHSASRIRFEQTKDLQHVHKLLRHRSMDQTWHYIQTLVGTEDSVAPLLEEKFGGL